MKRLIASLAGMLVALAAPVLVSPTPAFAATVPDGSVVSTTPITRVDASQAMLDWNSDDTAKVAAVEQAQPSLAPVSFSTVIGAASTTTQALSACNESSTELPSAQGFCLNSADQGSTWMPQGVTTSSGFRTDGTVNGHKVVVTSSYDYATKGNSATTVPHMRITIADVTNPSSVKYVHALLVMPSSSTATAFTTLDGHADAVILYGNQLYVGNQVVIGSSTSFYSGFNVFDLNHFWAVDAGQTGVGPGSGGTYQGGGFPYVLPRIGYFVYPTTGCNMNVPPVQPCVTAATLDSSGSAPAIVVNATVENGSTAPTFGAGAGSITRWPIDPTTGLLVTDANGVAHASDAYSEVVQGVQGIAVRDHHFILDGPCPEFPTSTVSCLYQAWLNEPVTLWVRGLNDGEDLAYDSQTNQLWDTNEGIDQHAVVHVTWPTLQPPFANPVAADFSGDGKTDLVGVDPGTGVLWLYPGNGNGTLGTPVKIGTNWDTMKDLTTGDFTGDGKADLLAVDPNGILWLYPGTGVLNGESTLANPVEIGSNWGGMSGLTAMDVNSDGKPDLLAVDGAGALWAYPGSGKLNGMSTLGNRTQIGSNWDTMHGLISPGPLVKGGKPYLLALDSNGAEWAYPATGTINGMSTLGNRVQIGSGWNSMQALVGGDFNGDGVGDEAAIETSTGRYYLYPGSGAVNGSTLGPRTWMTTNW